VREGVGQRQKLINDCAQARRCRVSLGADSLRSIRVTEKRGELGEAIGVWAGIAPRRMNSSRGEHCLRVFTYLCCSGGEGQAMLYSRI